MPKLEELRAWARGVPVDGLPEPVAARGPTLKERLEENANVERRLYKISADGTDALLKFGKYRGQTVSDVFNSSASEASDYFDFMMRKSDLADSLGPDFADVVRYQKSLRKLKAFR